VVVQDACVTRTSPGQAALSASPGGTLDTLSLVYALIPVVNKVYFSPFKIIFLQRDKKNKLLLSRALF